VAAKAVTTLAAVSAVVGVAVTQPWKPAEPEAEAPHVEALAQEAEPSPAAQRRSRAAVAAEPAEAPSPEPEAEEASAPEPAAHAAPSPPAGRAERPRPARAARSDSPAPEPAEASGPALALELGLLRRARSALGAGRTDAALAALREHAERFPDGALAAERDGTRALALCEAGRPGGAAAAERFLAAHPRSPLAPRVRRACP
ncbi:MAG TPA: hypothetical protein RMH80_07725, partial [Polyangiaceae bacterium LLY-WYZ-15_(1-7)]|nr:hypothetical protein [Polyangiaceae bacterium LLY-WYZ-15_(1-7)]